MLRKLLAAVLMLCLVISNAMAELDDVAAGHCRNWYEIFVYSFCDSDGDGTGDLPGVLSRLDYLDDMGYNGVWLMPIMPSPSYHKYDVSDYMAVDAQYGSMEDMRALVQGCHDRDIRIIIDLPVNHTSLQHPWFTRACEAIRAGDTEDPAISYYHFARAGGPRMVQLAGTDWYYEEAFSGGGMPDLALDNPAVVEEIRAIMVFWLKDVGVDGFRLDAVTSYFSDDQSRSIAFLGQLEQMAQEIKPGAYLVGECWAGLDVIAQYAQSGVDSLFLFPAAQNDGWLAKIVTKSTKPAASYANCIRQAEAAMPDRVLAPFLCNHDTGRAVGALQARRDVAKAKLAEGLLGMFGGASFTYYGEEIGMIGSANDPDKRIGMYWADGQITTPPPGVKHTDYCYPSVQEQLQDPASLLMYCRAVNHLRLSVPVIAYGSTTFLQESETMLLIERTRGAERCLIAMNLSREAQQTMTLPAGMWTIAGDLEALNGESLLQQGQLSLAPWSILVLTEE